MGCFSEAFNKHFDDKISLIQVDNYYLFIYSLNDQEFREKFNLPEVRVFSQSLTHSVIKSVMV